MTQRVNLTYSIRLSELESEVRRILDNAFDDLEDMVSRHSFMVEKNRLLSRETFEEIKNLREDLTNVDFLLGDINNIISSYLSYEAQVIEATNSPTPAIEE